MARHDDTSKKEVGKAMHEFKEGKLTTGNSDEKVTSRKQAVAIGLSQARKKGSGTPRK